ncbi:protein disulfide-isomerase TMX3-like [Dendronephthya gigantea]|uniref:protein disulfide-isomerase TMX3-like n=1 Tax=Dendronephthya gigantea TaxID=151771 RepID=UPI00106B7609|nr:protein disulfide-isomerase TMX3-like [Dendronephthya gigantea]XP_028392561.1 protein disulfide-isomerase TMX3-like [Dendronephthya gigantea]
MAALFEFLLLSSAFLVVQLHSHVINVDNSFNEMKADGRYWFVEFYAPWCGHCKRLEPIWKEVGAELAKLNKNIAVAQVDCTKNRAIAEENGIRGFPTIKFFRGKISARYNGAPTKDGLVEFALKSSRPILTEFKTSEEFEKRRLKSDVFFLFVKDDSQESEDYKKIVQDIAEQKIAQVVFYSIASSLLPESVKVDKIPSLLVFKDIQYYSFEEKGEPVNKTTVSLWVDSEKFLPFMFVTDTNINELADSGKKVVFLTFSKSKDHSEINKKMGEVGKKIAFELYATYGKDFQFAGIFDTDVIESIMMSSVYVPFVLVLDPQTRHYYTMPASEISESFNQEQLEGFLQSILDGKAVAHGGKSFFVRIWRIWWDVRSSAKEIWASSPLMAVVIFGLPFLVFGFLVVMICCLEGPSDDEHQDTGEHQEGNEEQREVDGDERGDSEDALVEDKQDDLKKNE